MSDNPLVRIVNGQLVVQAQVQQIQQPDGSVTTVALIPTIKQTVTADGHIILTVEANGVTNTATVIPASVAASKNGGGATQNLAGTQAKPRPKRVRPPRRTLQPKPPLQQQSVFAPDGNAPNRNQRNVSAVRNRLTDTPQSSCGSQSSALSPQVAVNACDVHASPMLSSAAIVHNGHVQSSTTTDHNDPDTPVQLDRNASRMVSALNRQINELIAIEQRTGENRQRSIEELVSGYLGTLEIFILTFLSSGSSKISHFPTFISSKSSTNSNPTSKSTTTKQRHYANYNKHSGKILDFFFA
jgi:hypothetical protein